MAYRFLADLVVCIHLGFIVFVAAGGLLVARWPRAAYCHLPAVAWAVVVEVAGWICPLTPLENVLRERGGGAGYETSFVERYIMPVIYPTALTRPIQIGLGMAVLFLNLGIYGWLLRRRGTMRRSSRP